MKIQKLNVSKNEISDLSGPALYYFLSSTRGLEVLYLHWNLIKGSGGRHIAKALQRNPIIKVLDISYNSIGGEGDSECIYQWCKLIENNKLELTHLDISYNNLTISEL